MTAPPARRRNGRAGGAALLAALSLLVAAGCGGAAKPGAGERLAKANAAELIDQLRGDLQQSVAGAATLADAQRQLHDPSQLFGLLTAYTDFGGCGAMLGNSGVESPSFRAVQTPIARACVYLERAAVLFTRATTNSDPAALLAASRTARRASSLLTRAKFELSRVR